MARIVIIGGVAAGMSAASQAKRRSPESEVVVLERGPYISYGACGMPYNLEDPARAMDDLVVLTPERARQRGIDVRTRHEVESVDPAARRLRVHDLATDAAYDLAYDALVIATGAVAARPPIPGLDLPGVFVLRELTDGSALKQHLADKGPQSAVIVGAGYIGMEMAEALTKRGLQVTVLEKLEQVVPGFEPVIAAAVLAELERHRVRVQTSVTVAAVERTGEVGALQVRVDGGRVPADLVLVSAGVRPNVALAREAGVPLGATGAIAVDAGMRTGTPGVFAAGDCAEAPHLVTGKPAYIPLGTTANKQGKVAGANAVGADERFGGIVGTAAFKVFDLEVGRTGLGLAEARQQGFDALAAVSLHGSRGHAYPGGNTITTVLVAERGTGRLLGAQMVGENVAKRVDVLATALHARMTVADVESLDLSYAPPFAPVYDPILVAATVARKEISAPDKPAEPSRALSEIAGSHRA
jgi:NADPH-dependent 2,4-dienoyl-CoA reductase/sulfur reductase-like enzyme